MGALFKIDKLLLNVQVRTFSGTVLVTSRDKDLEKGEPTGDRSQNDPYPKVEFFTHRTSNSFDSNHGETSDMVTRVQDEITYCSLGTSSLKQKKARSTTQPQFRSENTAATIESDQIFLAHQQWSNSSNSANFNNNISRNAELTESLTTTIPIFGRN